MRSPLAFLMALLLLPCVLAAQTRPTDVTGLRSLTDRPGGIALPADTVDLPPMGETAPVRIAGKDADAPKPASVAQEGMPGMVDGYAACTGNGERHNRCVNAEAGYGACIGNERRHYRCVGAHVGYASCIASGQSHYRCLNAGAPPQPPPPEPDR